MTVPTAYLLGLIDVRCPRCEAPACLPCRNVRTGKVLLYSYHRKRIELAAGRIWGGPLALLAVL